MNGSRTMLHTYSVHIRDWFIEYKKISRDSNTNTLKNRISDDEIILHTGLLKAGPLFSYRNNVLHF